MIKVTTVEEENKIHILCSACRRPIRNWKFGKMRCPHCNAKIKVEEVT